MPLNYRQRQIFKDLVHIYRADALEAWGDGTTRDLSWNPVPVYEDVPCYWEVKQDTTAANSPVGRFPADNIFTQDMFHFAWDIDVDGTWESLVIGGQMVIEIRTAGHPELGAYFATTGESTKLGKMKSQFVMAKRVPKLPGLT